MAKKESKLPELKFKKPVFKDPLTGIPKDILKFVPNDVVAIVSNPVNVSTLKAWVDFDFIVSVRITNKIVEAVNRGAAGKNKTTNAAAMQDWATQLQLHVYTVLPKNNWDAAEPTVLRVAEVMGDVAAQLTGNSNSECQEDQLKTGFRACKRHADCQASSSGGVGGGNWCTFDWL